MQVRLQIQIYQLILLGTKTNLGCMVDSVCAMLLVDALQQIGGIVLGRHLLLVDDVDTGLIERYGVGRGEDAIVLQLHGLGMIHAIAVY